MRSFLGHILVIPALSLGVVVCSILSPPALGQLVPDDTLGNEETIVLPNQTVKNLPADLIQGGAERGANLFHSFLEFNVNSGQRVYFDNPGGIDRILTRVTGQTLSDIAGTLGVLGNADLFLLNPNGILFGPNASLDVNGSFIGSTAASVQFNGFEFSATTPTAPPTLTLNVPLGLQYGQTTGIIEATGVGNHASGDPLTITKVNPQGGLTVQFGKTLALIGGGLRLNGAALEAVEGQITLMGVAGPGSVSLIPHDQGWTFAPQNLTPQPIVMESGSLVKASSGLHFYGSDLTLTDQSYILTQIEDTPSTGEMYFDLSDRLAVLGTSAIVTEALGTAAGVPLTVEAGSIEVDDGGRITSLAVGQGDAGGVTLTATEALEVRGQDPSIPGEIRSSTLGSGDVGLISISSPFLTLNNNGAIRSSTLGSGNLGLIYISSPFLTLNNGGAIASTSLFPGTGNAGEIRVEAQEIKVIGVEPVSLLPSAIRSATLSAGDAGLVKIESDRVFVTDGGRITALTASTGNAGEVRITASERITVEGRSPNQLPSLISAAANALSPATQERFNLPDVPSGDSGSLTLTAPEIVVQEGGLITTNNEGTGNAGTLSIFSDRLIVKNRGQISSTVLTGAGGEIVIDTGDLSLEQGLINASVLATGTGGDIHITAAGTIALTGIPLDLSTLFTEFAQDPLNFLGTSPLANGLITFTGNGGNSGQIDLQAQNLTMDSGAFITTSTVAQGDAGSIRLNIADQIRANHSYVLTTTFNTGNAGDLEVETQSLRTENGGLFATGYFGAGNGGKLTVTATESIDLADDRYGNIRGGFTSGSLLLGDITNPFTIPGNGGDLTVQTPRLSIRNGAALNSSAEGSGNAGNISILSDRLRLETGGYISSLSTVGRGGDIQITATEAIDIIQTDTFPNLSAIQLPLDPDLIRQVQSTGITSLSTGQSSGNINLLTKALTLTQQGLIASTSLGPGPGGNFNLQAESVLLDNSYIAASSYAQGDAGNISISTQTLKTLGNSLIGTFAAAEGDAGNITIAATDSVYVQGTGTPRELFVSERDLTQINGGLFALTQGSQGGNIRIQTSDLRITQQGELATSATGQGVAGDIEIESDRVVLDQALILATSNLGQGGNIQIKAKDWLFFQNGTRLSAQSGTAESGGGNGGNINLESPIILGIGNSDVIANAFEGDGGNINIVTQGLLGFTVQNVDDPLGDPRNNITASSRFGSSGTTNINSTITPTKGLVPLATALVDPANSIGDRCAISPNSDGNRFTATGRGGLPISPANLPTPSFLITFQSALSPQMADLNDRASLLFEQGDLATAYATWQEAADLAAAVEDAAGQRSIHLNQLQTLQLLGYQTQTYQTLSSLQTTMAQEPHSLTTAVFWFQLGNSAQSLGKLEEAAQALTEALTIAQTLSSPQSLSLSSQILLGLGHNARAQDQVAQAIEYYQHVTAIEPHSLTAFQAKVSALDLALTEGTGKIGQIGNIAETGQLLIQAPQLLPSRTSFYSQIQLASLLQQSLNHQNPLATPDQILHSLQHTTEQAQAIGDNLSWVYALGAQGELYEKTHQWHQAQQLTQQALRIAQPLKSPEVNYALLWQLGRILNQQGQTEEAIVAYRQAVTALQSIRTEIASNAPDVQFNFRDRVEPLYREFVRLLLAAETPSPESLKEARNLIENLQLAELNDYFQDACTRTTPIAVDQVDPTAAVIYPIILDDRLDVIVSLGKDNHLLHYSHPVSAQAVRDAVQEIPKSFSAAFRANSKQTHEKLQQFYDWLIQPAQSQLDAHNIETLVFIPDGALRNLSLSALYNGEHYLIEDYNIALSPGLNLMEPRPLSQRNATLFAGGLSQVNPSFSNEFSPLPFVEEELAAITTIVPKNREYLNETLVSSVLTRDLKELPFNIVHLATHGEFGRSAEETYLLTWDRKLGLDEFSQLLQESSRVQDPIELLVLSACETAAGNDRAVLGIAGMAIRSNARSTIASLRRVDDEATAHFMADFYQALVQPGVTKSQAFRQAQLALLRSPLYASPYYWAPFVLVGNWL